MSGFIIVTKATRPETGTHYAFFVYDYTYCNTNETPMKSRLIAFALALGGLTACNGFRHPTPADANAATIIQVDNQGFLDMTVYAQRSSQRIRLGIANGNSKTDLAVPSVLISGLTPLRFVADPIGGRRASVSEEITVAPGDTVVLTIPAV
jgi:hypothetical protein